MIWSVLLQAEDVGAGDGRFLGRPPLGAVDPRVPRSEEAAGVRGRGGDVGAGDGRGRLHRHALLARAWIDGDGARIDGGREGLRCPTAWVDGGRRCGWRRPKP